MTKIRMVLVLMLATFVCGCKAKPDPVNDPPITAVEAASRFQPCLRYVDGSVRQVYHRVTRYGEPYVALTFGRVGRDPVRFYGAYGFMQDGSKIVRIAYQPFSQSARRTGGLLGRIENVRFIPEDSVGHYPPENLCPLVETTVVQN